MDKGLCEYSQQVATVLLSLNTRLGFLRFVLFNTCCLLIHKKIPRSRPMDFEEGTWFCSFKYRGSQALKKLGNKEGKRKESQHVPIHLIPRLLLYAISVPARILSRLIISCVPTLSLWPTIYNLVQRTRGRMILKQPLLQLRSQLHFSFACTSCDIKSCTCPVRVSTKYQHETRKFTFQQLEDSHRTAD